MKILYIICIVLCVHNVFAQGEVEVFSSLQNRITTETDSVLVVATFGRTSTMSSETDDLLTSPDPIVLLLAGEITGVQDLPLIKGLEVFPNPVTSYAQLKCTGTKDDVTISVHGTNGQIIRQHIWKSGEESFQLSMQNFPSGMYLITATEIGNMRASQFKLVKR